MDTMGKRGPKRDPGVELIVAHLRDVQNQTFEEIGARLGFTRQRAHSIYIRWKNEPEELVDERLAVPE